MAKRKDVTVSSRDRLIECLAAMGASVGQISEKLGISKRTVASKLRTPESVLRVESLNRQVLDHFISGAASLGELFDMEAREAFNTLRELNRGLTADVANPVPHAVRLQAASQIMDRAPSAPGRKGEGGTKVLNIVLPESSYRNAQKALEDVGLLGALDVEPEDA